MAITPIDTRPITAEIERLHKAAELAQAYNALIDLRVPLEAVEVESNGNGHAPAAMTKGQKIAATRRANALAAAEQAERSRARRSAGQRARWNGGAKKKRATR